MSTDIAQRISNWGPARVLWLDSSRLEADFESVQELALDGVAVSPDKGFLLDSLGCLRGRDIRALVLANVDRLEVGLVEDFTELEVLSVDRTKLELDLSRHLRLRSLTLDWTPRVHLASRYQDLAELRLWKYRPKCGDLSQLPMAPNLHRLQLVKAEVQSTSGLGSFAKLRHLELSYAPMLTELIDLPSQLDEVELDSCKRVGSLDALASCRSLRILRALRCGVVPSLGFVRSLPALEQLRLNGTTIEDGDMTPCLRVGAVHFNNKKHYSHTLKQVQAGV